MSYKYFIGIDAGSNGAISIINSEGKLLEIFKIPDTIEETWKSLEKYKESIERGEVFGATEKIWSMAGNGHVGAFTLGYNVCVAITTLIHNKIPYEKVLPKTWQKTYSLISQSKFPNQTTWKKYLFEKAQELFPSDKFYIYQADALLIAEYLRRTKSK